MTTESDRQAPQVSCPNPKCGQTRTSTDRYCGACGSALQADLRQLVKWHLEEQTKDREVLLVETAEEIAEKVWGWGKLLMGIAGASTALFVLALAVVGYKSIGDINHSRADAQEAIAKAQAQADKSAADAKDSIKEMKSDLQTKLADIETKRKEVLAQFEKERGQLDEVGTKLPTLVSRINEVAKRLDAAEPQLVRLDRKVGELEDQFVGKPLAPAMADRLKEKLAPYRSYLADLGLRGSFDEVPLFHGGPEAMENILYLPTDPKIIIGSTFLKEEIFLAAPDAIAREFTHHVLFKSLSDPAAREKVLGSGSAGPLESGLADYCVASWTNNPSLFRAIAAVWIKRGGFSKDEVRNLKNDHSLNELKEFAESTAGGEIWGGLFWELRETIGSSTTDKLLAGAWKSLGADDVPESPLGLAKLFRDAMIKLAEPIENGKHVPAIRKVFERRGLNP